MIKKDKATATSSDDTPDTSAPDRRPNKGTLVRFATIDPVTGRRHNGFGLVREHLDDDRELVQVLPPDTVVCASGELTRI